VIINTVSDKQSLADAYAIRREALQHKVTHYTTLAAARAAAEAHRVMAEQTVLRLQDLHKELLV
jgi:carbamoyl-phosphate synthase large subunit